MKASIIAINSYNKMANLPNAEFDGIQVNTILQKTNWELTEWSKNQQFNLVYISSHGVKNGIILSDSTVVPLNEFVSANRLTVFDACFTGQSITPIILEGDVIPLNDGLVISSSKYQTFEVPELKGSILTESFCKEVENWGNQNWFTDKGISVKFLKGVQNRAKQMINVYTSGWQSPPIIGRLTGSIIQPIPITPKSVIPNKPNKVMQLLRRLFKL